MNPIYKLGLPVAWLSLVIYRGVFGGSDQTSRIALALLTVAVLVQGVIMVAHSIEVKAGAMRRGEGFFTSSTVGALLLVALIGGFMLRFILGGDEPDGPVAWAGGIIGAIALAGLFVLGYSRERGRESNRSSFFFSPNWKYGLLLICVVAMAVFSVSGSGESVLVFWLSAVVLVVQTVGRWIVNLRRRSTTTSVNRGS